MNYFKFSPNGTNFLVLVLLFLSQVYGIMGSCMCVALRVCVCVRLSEESHLDMEVEHETRFGRGDDIILCLL